MKIENLFNKDFVFITGKSRNYYHGISKKYGKVFINESGLKIKFPSLKQGFLISYSQDIFRRNSYKKILNSYNINLESVINYKNSENIIQLLFSFCNELEPSETSLNHIWELLIVISENSLNLNNKALLIEIIDSFCKEGIFFLDEKTKYNLYNDKTKICSTDINIVTVIIRSFIKNKNKIILLEKLLE
jgi:hypothetical protein